MISKSRFLILSCRSTLTLWPNVGGLLSKFELIWPKSLFANFRKCFEATARRRGNVPNSSQLLESSVLNVIQLGQPIKRMILIWYYIHFYYVRPLELVYLQHSSVAQCQTTNAYLNYSVCINIHITHKLYTDDFFFYKFAEIRKIIICTFPLTIQNCFLF